MSNGSLIKILVVSVALGGLVCRVGAADNKTRALDKHEAEQQKRIEQGIKSGELTPDEAARLKKAEAKLKADEAAAKADGKVTQGERKALLKEMRQDSQKIHALKHNDAEAKPSEKSGDKPGGKSAAKPDSSPSRKGTEKSKTEKAK
jgi:hypothetical protein